MVSIHDRRGAGHEFMRYRIRQFLFRFFTPGLAHQIAAALPHLLDRSEPGRIDPRIQRLPFLPLIDYLLQYAKGEHRVRIADPEPQSKIHGFQRLRGNPQSHAHPALMAQPEIEAVYSLGGNRGETAQPVIQPGLVPDPAPHQLVGYMVSVRRHTGALAWRWQVLV